MLIPLKPFYFIRHGQTDYNLNKVIMGQMDIPLNETGIRQAYDIQEIVKKINFKNIHVSPLIRAHKTAEIINEVLSAKLEFNEGLMERSQGNLLKELSENNDGSDRKSHNLGIESLEQFRKRVLNTIETILNKSDLYHLIISHGGVFNILVNELDIMHGPAENCVVYFFQPPDSSTEHWNISVIKL